MQLVGEYYHTLDAKNRLFIPSKHREILGENFMITRKVGERCLATYSAAEWEKFSEKLTQFPDSVVNKLKRFLYSKTIMVTPDAQGRVILPQEMLEFAGITKNVVTAGCGLYADIWAAERWEEDQLNDEPENSTEFMEEMGL